MDQQISEVTITLDQRWEDKLDDAVAQLTKAGLEVCNTDDENSVVEGTIEASKLADLQKLDCVEYVRVEFTYNAEFPPGDPRDKDGL